MAWKLSADLRQG